MSLTGEESEKEQSYMAEIINKKPDDQIGFKDVYVARQPIFDRNGKIYGYELLFRSGFDNFYEHPDGDYTTSMTIMNSFVTVGIETITGGKLAFINFTKNLILSEIAYILPNKLVAIEILETVDPADEVVNACQKIKKHGHLIVLDDFVFRPELMPFINIADIIKIDYQNSDFITRVDLISRIDNKLVKFLAEKVETIEEFKEAKQLGFSYFQGYFFSKPNIIVGRELPGYKLNYLLILKEVNKPDVEFSSLEHIVKRDVSLTYKLLRFINSAAFGFHTRIRSIKQALTLLGLNEFKKWVSLVALSGLGDDKPEELLVNSMIRAKFCEFLSSGVQMRDRSSELFLLGMFSMIDAFVDHPIEDILTDLPLSSIIKDALCGVKNSYRDVLDIVIAYEKANWDEWRRLILKYNLNEKDFPEIYASTLDWVRKIFRDTRASL